jgi:glycosyltransferase involved in cell wall biosynthesis
MRVAVLTTSYPSYPGDPAGHFVASAARALAHAGAEVHVVAPGGSVFAAPRRASDAGGGLWVHEAGGGTLFGWPGAMARMRQAPWRLVGALGFAHGVHRRLAEIGPVDRTVAHWMVPCGWPLALRASGELQVVAHGADVRLLCAMPAAARVVVVRALLARARHVSFASERSREALLGVLPTALAGALRRGSTVELPALDVDVERARGRACALRASLRLATGARLAVVSARLVAGKRVEVAVDAALSEKRLHLVVLGDGPERAPLERRAAAAGGRVRFLGTVNRDEALAWTAAADVLIHPSRHEAAPCVVREARLLDVPVIACAAGDVAQWAASDRGLRVVDPEPRAVQRAVDELLVVSARAEHRYSGAAAVASGDR